MWDENFIYLAQEASENIGVVEHLITKDIHVLFAENVDSLFYRAVISAGTGSKHADKI